MGQVQRLPAVMLDAIVLQIRCARRCPGEMWSRLVRCGLAAYTPQGGLELTETARSHTQVVKRLAEGSTAEPTPAQESVLKQVRKGRNRDIIIRGRMASIVACEREGWVTYDRVLGYEVTPSGEEALERLQRQEMATMIGWWAKHDGRKALAAAG